MEEKYPLDLFKYMPLTPEPGMPASELELKEVEKDKDRIKQILIDHKAYFSKPSKLNDIFECKPSIKIPVNLKDRKELAKNSANHMFPGAPRAKRREKTKIFFNKIHQMKTSEFSNAKFWEGLEGYGLFCLSTKPNSPVMWSHYASVYKGICICFNCPTPDDDDFGLLDAVTYQAEYPVVDLMNLYLNEDQGDRNEWVIKSVFTKSDEWSYEKEYRFCKGSFEGGNGLYKFNPERVKEIILGPMIQKNEKEFILEMVKQGLNNTAVYSSKISKTKYSIDKHKRVN